MMSGQVRLTQAQRRARTRDAVLAAAADYRSSVLMTVQTEQM